MKSFHLVCEYPKMLDTLLEEHNIMSTYGNVGSMSGAIWWECGACTWRHLLAHCLGQMRTGTLE